MEYPFFIGVAIKDYYIPLTEVRQIIYDADRFFHLKSIDEVKKHLEKALYDQARFLDFLTLSFSAGPDRYW